MRLANRIIDIASLIIAGILSFVLLLFSVDAFLVFLAIFIGIIAYVFYSSKKEKRDRGDLISSPT
jgi:cbb3-type cytochrome oxidase subunit 3